MTRLIQSNKQTKNYIYNKGIEREAILYISGTQRRTQRRQTWIVSRYCLGLETSRDKFFDVSVSVSNPTVSVSISRSFLDFLETVWKRKSCSFVEAVSIVLVQTVFCRSGLHSSRTNCLL